MRGGLVALALGLAAAEGAVARGGPGHQDHRDQHDDGEPGQARLAARHDDRRRQQRADRIAGMAADLEQPLCQALAAGGGMAGHARRLRMEYRRAQPDQRGGEQDHRVARRESERQQPEQRRAHAGNHRIGPGALVGQPAEQRLQQGRRHLEGQRDQADLAEIELEVLFDQRVERRDHRLKQIVQQMRRAQRNEDRDQRAALGGRQGECRHGPDA